MKSFTAEQAKAAFTQSLHSKDLLPDSDYNSPQNKTEWCLLEIALVDYVVGDRIEPQEGMRKRAYQIIRLLGELATVLRSYPPSREDSQTWIDVAEIIVSRTVARWGLHRDDSTNAIQQALVIHLAQRAQYSNTAESIHCSYSIAFNAIACILEQINSFVDNDHDCGLED
ncbi:MAG TPA: hypothetical protein V6C84_16175 [Coleofasciculaceae cyanobacterium]|jgi:hypothetical protein